MSVISVAMARGGTTAGCGAVPLGGLPTSAFGGGHQIILLKKENIQSIKTGKACQPFTLAKNPLLEALDRAGITALEAG